MSDGVSALTRVVEAQVHLRRARENIDDDRPELTRLLSRSIADVSEVRQSLAEEEATTRGWSPPDDAEGVSSD